MLNQSNSIIRARHYSLACSIVSACPSVAIRDHSNLVIFHPISSKFHNIDGFH